jgi:hypothetical protein
MTSGSERSRRDRIFSGGASAAAWVFVQPRARGGKELVFFFLFDEH